MIPKNLKVGDTFTVDNEIFEVLEVVELGYNSKRIGFVDEKKPVKKEEPVKEETQLDSFNDYTKTEINRLNVFELEKVCDQLGLEKGTGKAMKEAIIKKLGL